MRRTSIFFIAFGIAQSCFADNTKLIDRGVCLYSGGEYSLGSILCIDGFPIRCERVRTEAERKKLTEEALGRYVKMIPPGVPDIGNAQQGRMPFWSALSDPIPRCEKAK